MEYKIITIKADENINGTQFERTADQLTTEVNQQIVLGWEPQGGVCVGQTAFMKKPYLFQAMVKRR